MVNFNNRDIEKRSGNSGNHDGNIVRLIVCSNLDENRAATPGLLDYMYPGHSVLSKNKAAFHIEPMYYFFSSRKRRYIIAEFAMNGKDNFQSLAFAASVADVVIVLVDANKDLLEQTRQHSHVLATLGVRHIVLIICTTGRDGIDKTRFNAISSDYRRLITDSGFGGVQVISIPLMCVDHVFCTDDTLSWYTGPGLNESVDAVDVNKDQVQGDFRMPVFWKKQSGAQNRVYCGQVASGMIRPGDNVRVLPSGMQTTVKAVLNNDAEMEEAHVGDLITLELNDAVDMNPGDVLATGTPPEVADQFEADLLWISHAEMIPGRQYVLKQANREVTATITKIKYQTDIQSGAHLASKTLGIGKFGRVILSTGSPLVFERHGENRSLNQFFLIDRLTSGAVGAGMIDFALRRASNIHWQALELNKITRAKQKKQQPKCIWFTGLSGSGKSTIANLLEKRLHQEDKHTYLLDGDNVRHGLNRDLGFTEADRVENIRRVSEVAKLMVDAGLIVLVSFISPFRSERSMARELFNDGEFIEVFVDTELEECERRDVKGLYAKARSGALTNFTGIDSPYEPPEKPEVHIWTSKLKPEAGIELIMNLLR
ncbi:MAG: adenylyl-sulfate kinase [Nitrosomonas sp.]|nr:adenylyl-sulfate kinase [Nitrosomonas sp.]